MISHISYMINNDRMNEWTWLSDSDSFLCHLLITLLLFVLPLPLLPFLATLIPPPPSALLFLPSLPISSTLALFPSSSSHLSFIPSLSHFHWFFCLSTLHLISFIFSSIFHSFFESFLLCTVCCLLRYSSLTFSFFLLQKPTSLPPSLWVSSSETLSVTDTDCDTHPATVTHDINWFN